MSNNGASVDTDAHLITMMEATINNRIAVTTTTTTTAAANESSVVTGSSVAVAVISPVIRQVGDHSDSQMEEIDTGAAPTGSAGIGVMVELEQQQQLQSEKIKKKTVTKRMCQSKSTFYVPVNDSDIDEEAEEANE